MRNAVIVFTKVPKEGDIKTRLTEENGGILTPAEAKIFYEACLLDVIDVCTSADCGDVFICYNQAGDREYFDKLLEGLGNPSAIKEIYPDKGGSFDECIQYAADYILKDGSEDRIADSILIIGGDTPELQPAMVREAMKKVDKLAASQAGLDAAKAMGAKNDDIGAAIVEASCQEGGFSIVGYTCTTPFDFHGVFYNMDGVTALDMLVQKAAENNIPFGLIEMAPDVDIPVDLASIIPMLKAIKLAVKYDENMVAPVRTIKALEELGLETTTPVSQR